MEDSKRNKKNEGLSESGIRLLKQDDLFDEALKDLDIEFEKRHTATRKYPKWVFILLLLLGLAVGISIYFISSAVSEKHVPMAATERIPTSLVPNTRDMSSNQSLLLDGVKMYGSEDYKMAEQLILQYINEQNDSLGYGHLYLASMYSFDNKFSQANELLEKIENPEIADMVQWQKALNYQQYDVQKGREILLKISQNPNHYKSFEANRMLIK